MLSLSSPFVCSPAEDLHTSRVRSYCAHRAKSKPFWRLGTWNVRSLVDAEGSVNTARQGRDVCHAEDRRVDLVVRELKRYDVKVAALQETLWFGSAVYRVGESVVLAAGQAYTCSRGAYEVGGGSSHSTFWTSMENSRRAVEGVDLHACLCMPADR